MSYCLREQSSVLRELGADELIDYSTTRFEDVAHDVDVVLDSIGELDQISGLIDGGLLKTVIASDFPLAQARQAFETGLGNHARGKIVLQVADQAARNAR